MGSSSFPKLYGYEVARLLAKRGVGLSGMPAAITSASRCANWDVVALVSRSQRLLYAAQSTPQPCLACRSRSPSQVVCQGSQPQQRTCHRSAGLTCTLLLCEDAQASRDCTEIISKMRGVSSKRTNSLNGVHNASNRARRRPPWRAATEHYADV